MIKEYKSVNNRYHEQLALFSNPDDAQIVMREYVEKRNYKDAKWLMAHVVEKNKSMYRLFMVLCLNVSKLPMRDSEREEMLITAESYYQEAKTDKYVN